MKQFLGTPDRVVIAKDGEDARSPTAYDHRYLHFDSDWGNVQKLHEVLETGNIGPTPIGSAFGDDYILDLPLASALAVPPVIATRFKTQSSGRWVLNFQVVRQERGLAPGSPPSAFFYWRAMPAYRFQVFADKIRVVQTGPFLVSGSPLSIFTTAVAAKLQIAVFIP